MSTLLICILPDFPNLRYAYTFANIWRGISITMSAQWKQNGFMTSKTYVYKLKNKDSGHLKVFNAVYQLK